MPPRRQLRLPRWRRTRIWTTRNRESAMSLGDSAGGERFDVAYLVLSGTTTAARCPELLRGLVGLGFATVIAIPTPNASRVIASRDLAEVEGVRVVQSYFDLPSAHGHRVEWWCCSRRAASTRSTNWPTAWPTTSR